MQAANFERFRGLRLEELETWSAARARNPERDRIPPRDRDDRQTWPGYCIYHNHDDFDFLRHRGAQYFSFRPKSPVPSENPSSTPSPPWFATRPPKGTKGSLQFP